MSTQTRSGTEQLQDIGEGAQEAVGEVADEAAGQARGWVTKEVDRRSTETGEQITTVAQDARSFSQLLDNHEKQVPSRVFRQVADSGERVGRYLTTADADRIRTDVEGFGRRQPWLVALSTVSLGFAAARLLRASEIERARRREEALRAVAPVAPRSPVQPPAYVPPGGPGAVDPLAAPPADLGAGMPPV